MAKRVIRVRCLTDENVYDLEDGGLNERGEPTQSRKRAERALKKRLPVLGGDGSESLPLYALAETPAVFSPSDEFDRDLLKDRDGSWAMPTAKWLAEQKKRIAKRSDSARLAEEKVKQMRANAIVDNLAKLAAPADDGAKKGGKS